MGHLLGILKILCSNLVADTRACVLYDVLVVVLACYGELNDTARGALETLLEIRNVQVEAHDGHDCPTERRDGLDRDAPEGGRKHGRELIVGPNRQTHTKDMAVVHGGLFEREEDVGVTNWAFVEVVCNASETEGCYGSGITRGGHGVLARPRSQ